MPPTRGRRISRIRTPASKTGRGSTPAAPPRTGTSTTAKTTGCWVSSDVLAPPRRPVPLRGAAVGQRPGVAADAHRQNDRWRLADQRNDDWQAGYPIAISGASTGAALARPDRVEGAPLLLPEALWGWYDGRTQVTLPSGRIITPPNRTYLRYNPDAFVGRVVRTPNGLIVADQYRYGDASQTYNEIRTDSRVNIDISVRRRIPHCDDQPRVRRRREQRAEPYAIQRGCTRATWAGPRRRRTRRSASRWVWVTRTTTARAAWIQPAPHDGACDVPLLKPLPASLRPQRRRRVDPLLPAMPGRAPWRYAGVVFSGVANHPDRLGNGLDGM